MEDDDSWGLQAVVRSCGRATTAPASSSSCYSSSSSSSYSSSSSAVTASGLAGPFFGVTPANPPLVKEGYTSVGVLGDRQLARLLCCSTTTDAFDPLGELRDLFRPFFPRPAPQQPEPSNPLPLPLAKVEEEHRRSPPPPPPPPVPFAACVLPAAAGAPGSGNLSPGKHSRPRRMCNAMTSARSKRRKNLVKKVVCQVPADALCSDMWAWRKYGQKPIKGSPFPRGYYRCSSSKGCPARKQVERSRTDPGMFVITYTSDHTHPVPTHRSCLAGSTRHKSPPPVAAPDSSSDGAAAACANPTTSSSSGSKPSVSASPLSSVEEDLLLPVPEDVVGAADDGVVDDQGGLILVSEMDMDDMLGGCVEPLEEDEDDDVDGLLFSAPGFCSSPTPPGPDGAGGAACSWRRERDEHGSALPFAAASR